MWINWEEQVRSETDCPTQEAPKPLTEKTCRACVGGKNSHPHIIVCWRDPQDPRPYTMPPHNESSPEGANLFVDSELSD